MSGLILQQQQYNIGYICTRQQCEQGRADQVAMRWIAAGSLEKTDYTFLQLDQESNRFANCLLSLGFQEGDILFTFLPKMPEQFFAFLGILKIKAIAGTLFSNFGDEALLDRLTEAKGIVTRRSLLKRVMRALPGLPSLRKIIVVDIEEHIDERILSYPKLMRQASTEYYVPVTPPDAPSILHYTSGSTGKPKGVLHVHGAVLSHAKSGVEVLQLKAGELFWCTADQGWVTGTSYGIIAPWSLGVTQIHYGGGYSPQDWFSLLEREQVTIWYTAPTALRMLMREGITFYQQFKLPSLKHVFSVGEPLNPEIIHWSRKALGHDIYDTWFQTETGSILIANRPGLAIKPGSMGKPLDGITARIIDEDGSPQPAGRSGNLCLVPDWPSLFVTYLNHKEVYSQKFRDGYYYSGDAAYQDAEGYFWFVGRNDDIINTAGHLVSPFEVESSLLEIDEIAESGVIGAPDEILFEKVVAFIVLKSSAEWSSELEIKIRLHINNRVSSIASPQDIRVIDALPKNKSGKILRRVLKAQYLGEDPGDLSTLDI